MEATFDRIIVAGRVFCAESRLDGPGSVAVSGDRIAAPGTPLPGTSTRRHVFPDDVLVPGLVDFHAHPGRSGSKFGVDPDIWLLRRGTTTVMSQGDAGAANWQSFAEKTVEASRCRVLLALNLAAAGEASPGGSLADLSQADVRACVRAVERIRTAGAAFLWGIAVNTSRATCGHSDPREVMRRALAAAEETGLPLLVGTRRHDDWSLDEQLPLLRRGDVVTYCFHAMPEGLLDRGRVRDSVWRARERGVLFDVGHGRGSFSFDLAEAALAEGFGPDTISTDFYAAHAREEPEHDLPGVISKLIAAGMRETDAFAAATRVPASVLGLRHEVGALKPGLCADLTVLRRSAEPEVLTDTIGGKRLAHRWRSAFALRGGMEHI